MSLEDLLPPLPVTPVTRDTAPDVTEKPPENQVDDTGDTSDTAMSTCHGVPALDADGYPVELCRTCGGGDYYHTEDGWRCTRCYPPETPPRWTLTISGGTVPEGEHQDVDAVLHRAVAGTPVAVETLRAALDDDDVVEIAHGRLSVAEVRAFAETLDAWPVEPPEAVTCATCTHYRRSDHHPHLGTCAAGVIPGGAAGLWDTDRRHCSHWRQS